MIKRTTRILLEVVAAVAALLVIVVGVGVWRLAQGPVELDFLTPRLEAALSEGGRGFDVAVGRTVLAWEGWPETFAIRLRDVRVTADRRHVASVPSLDLRLSLSALLNGTVAPTSVTGRRANLVVIRGPDGLRFADDPPPPKGQGAQAPERHDVSEVLPALLDDLMAASTPDRPLSYLERLRVRETRLVVRDEILNQVWVAPRAEIALRRAPGGIDGTARLDLRTGGAPVTVDAAVGYQRGSGRIDLVAGFDGLRPNALAELVPQLGDAGGVSLPLKGTVSASVSLSGTVTAASANLSGGPGEIAWPVYLPDPRPVRALSANVHYTAADQRVRVKQLRIDFGADTAPEGAGAGAGAAGNGADGTDAGAASPRSTGPVIAASATASGLGGDVELEASLRVDGLDMDRLGDYWPVGLGGNARAWVVENIRSGRAHGATLETRLTLPGGDPDALRLHALSGQIAYSGLDVHYLRPLAPVRGVDGTASFDADSLSLEVAGGRLDELRVTGGDIEITGLDTTDHRIAIDLGLTGPLSGALQVLDQPRLDLMAPLGLDPAAVSGRIAQARLTFGFPLVADLSFERTEVRAQGRLTDVAVRAFALGQDARGGQFDLTLDKTAMSVDGPVELGGVPLTMSWRESFRSDAEVATTIQATVPKLDNADRSRLGLDTRPFVDGPVSGTLIARTYADGRGVVNASANLNAAALSVPFANWSKPAGEPGSATASLRLTDGTPDRLQSFSLDAGGAAVDRLSADGSVELGAGRDPVDKLTLARFTLARTQLRGMAVERTDAGWRLSLKSGVLDLTRLLGEGLLAGDRADAGSADPGPAVEIARSRLDRVYLAEDRYVENVTLRARRGADGWWRRLSIDGEAPARFRRAARVDGSLPPAPDGASPAPFTLVYAPGPDGRRQLDVSAQDSGAMLRAVDLFDNIEGGRMRVTGRARGAAPDSPVDAEIEVSDFKLVNAPTMARILTIASFTGINDLLQGQGIGFQKLDGEAVYDRGTLSTELLHAYGPALGLTTKGSVDLDARTLDLNGVVVPAASTNRILGGIPVLGGLLTGGEGEGLFAVTYAVTGPFDQPNVDVNPLSALAPGFLRGLFGRLGDLQGSAPEAEAWPKAIPGR